MTYITNKGDIISGETPVEIFEKWKESSPFHSRLTFWSYVEYLTLRAQFYQNKRTLIRSGLFQLLDELEEVGIIVRVQ
ncbi:hypothetical protein [Telluribacter humicola]|uniref:hypothetical protein n=1 Tax=Telluribacter humicola TaxID=1720261 RepID=UPI001A959181|nr:hypothetical protein [Telluribacter humicola]